MANHLSAGGFRIRALNRPRRRVISEKFGQSDQQLLITVTDPAGATGEAARAAGIDIVTASRRLAPRPERLTVDLAAAAAAELLSGTATSA